MNAKYLDSSHRGCRYNLNKIETQKGHIPKCGPLLHNFFPNRFAVIYIENVMLGFEIKNGTKIALKVLKFTTNTKF